MGATGQRRRGLALALALVLGACGAQAAGGPVAPTAMGEPALPTSDTLASAAGSRAEEMCDAGAVVDEPDAAARYDQETWVEVVEHVGRARIGEAGERPTREDARAEVEGRWGGATVLSDPRWDRIGSGEVACDDGWLYVVAVQARAARAREAGRYRTARVSVGAIHVDDGVRYGRARGVDGTDVDLLLDVYAPPTRGEEVRPALILIHGGGFAAGSRSMHRSDAMAYARRGFVAITIDYRLDPQAGASTKAHRAAARAALDDGMEAVRWVRAHARQLRIDPERIAALGASAGGEIALGIALLEDRTTKGPYAKVAPTVAAAVSTGAYLTPVLGTADLDADDAPILLHFFETDTASGRPWTYAAATCEAVRSAGGTCDLEISPGSDHTVGIGPTSTEADRISAFLGTHLRLADA